MAYGSTIIKKKKKLKCGCFDFNFSRGRCKMHSTIEDTAKRIEAYEATDRTIDEEDSRKSLIEDLDAITSLYVRIRDSDINGIVSCCTCGTKAHYKEVDAGHFIPRIHLTTRWDANNIFGQCKKSNQLNYGEQEKFEIFLENRKKGMVEYLRSISKQIWKPTISELKELLSEMKYKLSIAKTKLKT